MYEDFRYMHDRIMAELHGVRRQIEDLSRQHLQVMHHFHAFHDYVDRIDPRIRDGYLMEQRLKEATRSSK